MSHECPDDLTLAALFDGLLDPAERDALHGEMSRCPECQTTLILIGLGLADEPAEVAELAPVPRRLEAGVRALYVDRPAPARGIVVRRVREALQSLADALAPSPRPALAMRGAGEAADLRFEIDVEGTPIELLLAGVSDRTRVTIRPLDAPPPRTRVVLARGAEVEASLDLGSEGIGLPPLAAGRYALRFEVPGRPDTVLPLELQTG